MDLFEKRAEPYKLSGLSQLVEGPICQGSVVFLAAATTFRLS